MPRPFFLFAPGAGAPSSHPWMIRWAKQLATLGPVELLDYSYMREGRRRPDPLPLLMTAHREALVAAERAHGGPAVLIGKSMGGRIGCHVSLDSAVAAVICLGYPLCGGGDQTKLRDAVLRKMTAPVLFVQGTRDSLCPLDLLENVRREMQAPNELHIVEEGDHSLVVSKRQLARQSETQEAIEQRIVQTIADFVSRHAPKAA